jgi:putative colanic acid biosynthesis glycosyltransferase
MKILSINLFYKEGSTGKILYEIHKGLISKGYDSVVCHALGKHNEENVYKFSSEFFSKFFTYISALTGMQYTYSYLETLRLIALIKRHKPDIVHVHVINCNTVNIYRLLDFLKKNNFRTIITFHAEFLYTGGCSHALDCTKWKTGCGKCPRLWDATHSLYFDWTHYFWKKFESIYSGFENRLEITCVSGWLRARAVQSPFFKNINISIIENGTDTKNIFFPQKNEDLIKKYNLSDKKVILHVTPSFRSKIKGGEYILKLGQRLDKELYSIIIIGYDDNQNLPSNIIPIKHIKDQKLLAEYYSMADLTIITSKVETYSMVCAESLSCGTPVVGFKCGAPEYISLKEYSCFVENGNMDALEDAVYNWIDKKDSIKDELIKSASDHYSTDRMVNKYIELYNNNL